jgi:hypothetical protein
MSQIINKDLNYPILSTMAAMYTANFILLNTFGHPSKIYDFASSALGLAAGANLLRGTGRQIMQGRCYGFVKAAYGMNLVLSSLFTAATAGRTAGEKTAFLFQLFGNHELADRVIAQEKPQQIYAIAPPRPSDLDQK